MVEVQSQAILVVTASLPLKSYRLTQIGSRIVFQPPFFRVKLLNFGGVYIIYTIYIYRLHIEYLFIVVKEGIFMKHIIIW